jgi:hypothetical protein
MLFDEPKNRPTATDFDVIAVSAEAEDTSKSAIVGVELQTQHGTFLRKALGPRARLNLSHIIAAPHFPFPLTSDFQIAHGPRRAHTDLQVVVFP